jgi:hypothetical protein
LSIPNFIIIYCKPRELWRASDKNVFVGAPWAIKSSDVGYWESLFVGAIFTAYMIRFVIKTKIIKMISAGKRYFIY